MSRLSVIFTAMGSDALQNCDKILQQQGNNLEFVIVTDSADAAAKLSAGDSRTKIVPHSGDVLSARNTGLKNATGDFVLFADSTCRYSDGCFEKAAAAMESENLDLLVLGLESSDKTVRAFIDGNIITRSEYLETLPRFITTGAGFDFVCNKVFAKHIIDSRSMQFDTENDLVAEKLFCCRYFAASHRIKCDSLLKCTLTATEPAGLAGTDRYLAQGKVFSQALIDALQSKGLYSAAQNAIMDSYSKMLYRHLVLLCRQNSTLTDKQRADALAAMSKTSDGTLLQLYLGNQPDMKHKLAAQLFKLGQWKLLIKTMG